MHIVHRATRSTYEQDYLDWYNGRSLHHAHKASFANRKQLATDKRCGCYHCGRIFHPALINSWVKDRADHTALCPFCGIDSVLGEGTGFPITPEFLERMNQSSFH